VDVIPDTLAVISLNTIYFYDSNKGERRSPSIIFVASVQRARSSALEVLGRLFIGLPTRCPSTFGPQGS
jgi:hypothetical protein